MTKEYSERIPWADDKPYWNKDKKLKPARLDFPLILFEILPPNARKRAQTEDFYRHQRYATLEGYIQVSQDEPYVEMYRSETNWERESFSHGESIKLDLLNMELSLASIYDGVL